MATKKEVLGLRTNFCFSVSLDSGSETDNRWGLEGIGRCLK